MPGPYYDPATAESEQDHYLNIAADIVQRLAPAPEPEPTDYADKASRAERLLLNWLGSTSGASLTSAGGDAGSVSFTDMEKVRNIVRTTMGDYYIGGGTPVPIRRPYRQPIPYFINDPLELQGPFLY